MICHLERKKFIALDKPNQTFLIGLIKGFRETTRKKDKASNDVLRNSSFGYWSLIPGAYDQLAQSLLIDLAFLNWSVSGNSRKSGPGVYTPSHHLAGAHRLGGAIDAPRTILECYKKKETVAKFSSVIMVARRTVFGHVLMCRRRILAKLFKIAKPLCLTQKSTTFDWGEGRRIVSNFEGLRYAMKIMGRIHTHDLELGALVFAINDLETLLRRLIELFSDYDCEIRYHLGKANVVADALSLRLSIRGHLACCNNHKIPDWKWKGSLSILVQCLLDEIPKYDARLNVVEELMWNLGKESFKSWKIESILPILRFAEFERGLIPFWTREDPVKLKFPHLVYPSAIEEIKQEAVTKTTGPSINNVTVIVLSDDELDVPVISKPKQDIIMDQDKRSLRQFLLVLPENAIMEQVKATMDHVQTVTKPSVKEQKQRR
ncbi:hypothetical protein Tco_0450976 [Tanacetum coccineum]